MNTYRMGLLALLCLLAMPAIAQDEATPCPGCNDAQLAEPATFCYTDTLFPAQCAQFVFGQANFYLNKGKKKVKALPVVEGVEGLLALADNKRHKLTAREMLFVERALTQWALEERQLGYEMTDTGLGIRILEAGSGPNPTKGQKVTVHYTGYFVEGGVFDSSVERGTPFSFTLGQGRVIKGWEEGIAALKVGTKALLKLPPELAYGERGAGSIPPNSTLIFEVELLKAE